VEHWRAQVLRGLGLKVEGTDSSIRRGGPTSAPDIPDDTVVSYRFGSSRCSTTISDSVPEPLAGVGDEFGVESFAEVDRVGGAEVKRLIAIEGVAPA